MLTALCACLILTQPRTAIIRLYGEQLGHLDGGRIAAMVGVGWLCTCIARKS
jgi:hypothetical protein